MLLFLFYVFSIVSPIRLNSRRAVLIVVGTWLLITVVLANSYASTLLSFMSVKKFGTVINSLDDLAHSKETQLTVSLDWDLYGRFFVSFNSCA